MSETGNGEFKGSTTARLSRIEGDIQDLKKDVGTIREQVIGWKAQLAILGFALPIAVSFAMHVLFP